MLPRPVRQRLLRGFGYFACALRIAAATPAVSFDDIPGRMQALVDHGQVSGVVTLVATKDRILHLAAVGKSDLASGRAMKTDDFFWIASMTKPITAVCVAMLAEEGRLAYDDPLEKYLPEFGKPWVLSEQTTDRRVLVRPTRPITLRDVLTHTSGMGEYPVTDPHWTLGEMTTIAAREPLRFQPGSRWGYSTAGIDALGRVVEVVSGQPFADFVQRRILDPLGMSHTTFWLTAEQEKRFATSYRLNQKTGQLDPATIFYMYGGAVTDHARPALGGAGLFSTAEDVVKFYQMMLNGGEGAGHRLLRPATVAEMTRNQTGAMSTRPGLAWGLGFNVIVDPNGMKANSVLSPGSFGHGGAYGTNSWADPVRGVIYILMLQRAGLPNADDSDMRRAFQETASAAFGPSPASKPSALP